MPGAFLTLSVAKVIQIEVEIFSWKTKDQDRAHIYKAMKYDRSNK